DLVLGHQPERLVEVLLRVEGHEIARGDLRHLDLLRVAALGDDADGDVAVGEHADEAVALDDRSHPDVLVTHHLRGVGDGLVDVDAAQLRGHHFAYGLGHLSPLSWFQHISAYPGPDARKRGKWRRDDRRTGRADPRARPLVPAHL